MPTLGIFGPQGSGKSFIAISLARSLMVSDPDIKLYTNMNVEGRNINVIDDLGAVDLADSVKKILIVDEAYFSLDSRNSSSKQNRIWTRVYALFRKSDFILTIFITHRPRMIDVNIRDQLNYILMCRKNKQFFDYLLMDIITEFTMPIQIPKTPALFKFADFDTKDFPNPISVDSLVNHPLFSIAK